MDHQIHRRLDWLLPSWLEDADAYDQSINEDMTTVYYTIAVNVIVLAGCVLFFSFYRMYDDKIFSPKSALMPDRTPPRIPNDTAFGWIYHLWSIDDNILIDKGGYDVLFFIRFYRLSFKIFVSFTVYAWAVLLPINGTGSAGTAENSFEVWSMTNIPQGSPRCWFHLIGMYMLTGITIFFLEKEFVVYAKHRHVFLRQRHAHLRTVLVEGIPHKMRSTRTLATYFETLYPGAVLSVRLGQDLRYLDSLILEREDVAAMLERALFLNHLKNKRPTMYIPNMLERVDSIKYYTQVLEDLNEAVLSAQATALALTQYDEKDMTEGRALGLIEGFLHVTEIGSLKRLLKGRGKDKWALRGTRSSGGGLGKGDQDQPGSNSAKGGDVIQKPHSSLKTDGAISSLSRLLASSDDDSGGVGAEEKGGGEGDGDAENVAIATEYSERPEMSPLYRETGRDFLPGQGGVSGIETTDEAEKGSGVWGGTAGYKSFRVYRMTWGEWMWTAWTAPSWSDCWRSLKEGRHAEAHGNDGFSRGYAAVHEGTSLISPPEERKLYLSKAFVTFKTFTAATTARQVVHMQLAGHLAVTEAPEPTDMTWSNLYSTRTGTMMRRFVVESAVLLLIVVWVAPVTLISFIVSEDALRSYSTAIDHWCTRSELFLSAVELVQPAALVAIMNCLPPILTALGVVEGCVSFSSNQFRSFDRYFTFQVINVFLVTTIAGSVIDCVKEIYLDPSSAFALLGSSLPKMGGYFANFLIMKAFIGLGMEIIRLPAMCAASLKYLLTSNITPRDRNAQPLFGSIRAMHNPGWFPFSKIYAQDALLVVLCATYACIAPLILAGGLCYFWGASFVYKHQLLYVYEPIYETGGRWWPKLARCFVVALLFAQATMVGMLILKETYTQIYPLALLILITSYYYWVAYTTYEPLAAQLPFDMALCMDLDQQECSDDLHGHEEYIQPSLRAGSLKPVVEFGDGGVKEVNV